MAAPDRIRIMEAAPFPEDLPAGAEAPAPQSSLSFSLLNRLRGRKQMTSPDGLDRLDHLMLAVGRNGDAAALEALFLHFGPLLKSWLVRSGSSPSATDDLLQDTFVTVWHKARQFDPARARVAAWVFTIARNLRIDRLRRPGESWSTLEDGAVLEIPAPDRAAEDILDSRQRELRVRWALSQLTTDQRTLLQLNFYEDQSHSQIAAQLGLPLGTVKTRLRRAAALLRDLLDEHRP
jgi:RNA polymerase sigma factor (sigma-70 family)